MVHLSLGVETISSTSRDVLCGERKDGIDLMRDRRGRVNKH
jgi:hypothetical protein